MARTMGLFRKAGEAFEEAKQSFVAGKNAGYVCLACEKPVPGDVDDCPHCGETAVEPTE